MQSALLDGPGRNLTQIAGCSIHLAAELRLPRRHLRSKLACERRDGALLQLGDLGSETLDRRIRVGVVVAVRAQLRLLVAQFLQRIRQRRRMLDRVDGGQRLRR